jgi:tetratricopeptide (TPR) repeat protein
MDFCVVAKEKSIDSTADEGGYMGRINPEQLRDDLRQGFSSLKPGGVSGIIKTPKGFAILTVFATAPNRPDLDKKRIAAIGSSKAVRQSIVVSGQSEAKGAFEDFPKPSGWDGTLDQPCAIRKASLADALDRMQKLLAEAESQPSGEVPPRDLLEGYTATAQLHAYVGQMQPSIEAWLKAYKIAQTNFPASIPYLQETIGVSYLHMAEMENGIWQRPSDLDIFPPLDPHAHFQNTEHVKLAIEYFLRYLEQRPNDQEVRWMLNLAYVAMGRYPSGVPAKYLISASAITPANGSKLGRFSDVASSAGLNAFKT